MICLDKTSEFELQDIYCSKNQTFKKDIHFVEYEKVQNMQ